MDSSAAKTGTAASEQVKAASAQLKAPLPSKWLRAIIRAVGDRTLTIDQIRREVGTQVITPETAAIDEYVHALVEEEVLQELGGPQRFQLTEGGRRLLKGVLASPSAE